MRNHLLDTFTVHNGLKNEMLYPHYILFFSPEYTIKKVKRITKRHYGMILINGDDVTLFEGNINTKKNNAEILIQASRESDLELIVARTKYIHTSNMYNLA
jgi:hypothetical protein